MHNMEFLIGFHSNQLSNLIQLLINQVCWNAAPSTCWCFLLYPELQT